MFFESLFPTRKEAQGACDVVLRMRAVGEDGVGCWLLIRLAPVGLQQTAIGVVHTYSVLL